MEQTDIYKKAFQNRLNETMVKQSIAELQCIKGRPNTDQLNEMELIRLKERETVRGLPTIEQLKEMEENHNSAIKGLPK